eukprot:jgi/Ulvmu1/8248/UM041_0059.1
MRLSVRSTRRMGTPASVVTSAHAAQSEQQICCVNSQCASILVGAHGIQPGEPLQTAGAISSTWFLSLRVWFRLRDAMLPQMLPTGHSSCRGAHDLASGTLVTGDTTNAHPPAANSPVLLPPKLSPSMVNGTDHVPGDHARLVAPNVVVRFLIPFDTKWGEVLLLTGSRGLLGGGTIDKGLKMSCSSGPCGLLWETSLVVPDHYECDYRYVVYNEHCNQVVKRESASHHLKVPASMAGSCLLITDQFKTLSTLDTIYKSAAFKDVIFAGHFRDSANICDPEPDGSGFVTVRFGVSDHTLGPKKAIYVEGSIPELGSWRERKGFRLRHLGGAHWGGDIQIASTAFPFTYKYFITDDQVELVPECFVEAEAGEERVAALSAATSKQGSHPAILPDPVPSVVCLNDGQFCHARPWRGSGLAVPVFSMRTKDSVGCGEFLDIKRMVSFVAACGMHVLQVLPVNDTQVFQMWWDSYPYSSTSVFALHPIYLSLPALVGGRGPPGFMEAVEGARRKHHQIDMDYEETLADKLRLSRTVFDSSQGRQDLSSAAFQDWMQQNSGWLKPYAAFCFLRDLFESADHRQWGLMQENAEHHTERLTAPDQPFHLDICYTYWLQWHLHKQLLEAADFAREQRVVLKGDLPIGVAKSSADTWYSPQLFCMDVSVGSPPDAFDAKGQNWGFPGYNWDEMSKDGYKWWTQRLTNMAQYFTAYRVDHILGFFRIFQIPEKHVAGVLGHFKPSRPLFSKGLENMGLWDLQRLSEPYVPVAQLRQELGEDADEAIGKYFVFSGSDMLQFKSPFRSERVIDALPTPPDSPDWLRQKMHKIRSVLMQFLGNVILIQDEHDKKRFYPRFNLMETSSFAAYDPSKHDLLRQLHDGYYYKNHMDMWADCARRTIPALMQSTNMLMCGEDLGFVPACVPPVMHELGVVGLRIQRMPGPEATPGQEFGNTATYSYWTVAAPSCHDTTTMRAWYDEDEPRRERFFYHCLNGTGEVPPVCNPDIARAVLQQHLASPSIFCIIPLQDWLALRQPYYERPADQETINDPSVKRHYWRWRMRPHIEDLMHDNELLYQIQNLNLTTGRAMVDDLHELGR